MNWLDAIILGTIEGLTEFLPVSSTGHLILANNLLGLKGEAINAYTIVIQFGAIMAVLGLYRQRAWQMIQGLLLRSPAGLDLFLKLIVAFIPAAIFGLLLGGIIEQFLFYPMPVAGALVVGGVVMIAVERLVVHPASKSGRKLKSIEDMSYLDALWVGIAQCLALWPGTSRSMCTILGAQLRGFSDEAAAELSFLLALPTLGSATVYMSIKEHEAIGSMEGGVALIIVGNLVALIVAAFAVKWFVGVVRKYGMVPFGIYRIVIGLVFLLLALTGYLSLP